MNNRPYIIKIETKFQNTSRGYIPCLGQFQALAIGVSPLCRLLMHNPVCVPDGEQGYLPLTPIEAFPGISERQGCQLTGQSILQGRYERQTLVLHGLENLRQKAQCPRLNYDKLVFHDGPTRWRMGHALVPTGARYTGKSIIAYSRHVYRCPWASL